MRTLSSRRRSGDVSLGRSNNRDQIRRKMWNVRKDEVLLGKENESEMEGEGFGDVVRDIYMRGVPQLKHEPDYSPIRAGKGLRLPGQGLRLSGQGCEIKSSKIAYSLEKPSTGELPGDALKKKLLKKMLRDKKKGSGLSLAGSGLSLAGGSSLTSFITGGIIPSLLKSVNIKGTVNKKLINSVVSSAISKSGSSNPSVIAGRLAKGILPLLVHSKAKSLGKKMSGSGVMSAVKKAKNLEGKLAKGILQALKLVAEQKKKGASGAGLSLAGGDFWSDFARGFKMVFVPGSKVVGPILGALGLPMVGTAVTALGELIK